MPHSLGFILATAGGLLAAQSDNDATTAVGLIIGLTGLLGGFTALVAKLTDYRLAMRRMDDQEAKLRETQEQLEATKKALEESRVNAHSRADSTQAQLTTMTERVESNIKSLQGIAPVARELAERNGITAQIPDPAKPWG